ncbi:MAG: hypothetical protein IPK66_03280 [Rhodospirillales bacterium]|nr:hypothetical protein [Rhodospirillales bacterium]
MLSRRLVVLAPLLALIAPAQAQVPSSAERAALASQFGFTVEDARRLGRGLIISKDAVPSLRNELAATAAVRLPAPLAIIAGLIRDGVTVSADPSVSAYRRIDEPAGRSSGAPPNDPMWAGMRFADSESEVRQLLEVEPGDSLNLSADEITTLGNAGRLRVGDSLNATVARAVASYQAILINRFRAYRDHGLAGLANYDRGDTVSSPAAQLREIDHSSSVPARLASIVRDLDRFPDASGVHADNYFYWKKTKVEGRSLFILSHVLVEEQPDAVLFAMREYYVGHTYNTLQQAGIVLPNGESSDLFIFNSTLTDRITGVFSSIARAIGQQRSRDALEAYLASLRGVSARFDARPLAQYP